jgi:archaellum biogenesis ATPase FlaH
MIEIRGGKKERAIRQWFTEKFNDQYPINQNMTDLWDSFKDEVEGIVVSYGMLNGIMKDIKEEVGGETNITISVDQEPEDLSNAEILSINDLEFPRFGKYKTGKFIDSLLSDHDEDGGLYTGTVNVVVGESGVGKSTVMLDVIANIQKQNPDAKVLYVSSEMTRNDIYFYKQKTPIIGDIPTLLMMDYTKSNNMDRVLEELAFNGDYDIVLLDSYQDMVVKFKDLLGWKATYAETWLTNLMISAADKLGIAILAIQHLTKGGTYVGSTYLKHATTSMLEFRFDSSKSRYLEFSKNRRGGGTVGKRLYFTLEDGDIVYDEGRFNDTIKVSEIQNTERERQEEAEKSFNDMFLKIQADSVETIHEEEEDKKVFTIEEAEDVEERVNIPLEIVNTNENDLV